MKNSERPIAESGFRPNINPNAGPGDDPNEGWDKPEYATPESSGVVGGVYALGNGRDLPWHVALSRQLNTPELMQAHDGLMTLDEVIDLGGLDITFEKWPLRTAPEIEGVYTEPFAVDVPRRYAVVRTDTRTPIEVVGESFTPHQYREALKFCDDLVDDSGAHWDVVGLLAGGAKAFVVMELPDHIAIEGDPSDYRVYLIAMTGNDSRTKTVVFATVERAVCRNTIRVGRERAISEIALKHTSPIGSRIGEARRTLGISIKAVEVFAAQATDLINKPLAQRQVDAILDRLFPLTEVQKAKVEKDPEKFDITTQGKVRAVYTGSPTVEPIRGTAYGVLNAVTEYMDHERTYNSTVMSKGDAKALALMTGSADAVKQSALKVLSEA